MNGWSTTKGSGTVLDIEMWANFVTTWTRREKQCLETKCACSTKYSNIFAFGCSLSKKRNETGYMSSDIKTTAARSLM